MAQTRRDPPATLTQRQRDRIRAWAARGGAAYRVYLAQSWSGYSMTIRIEYRDVVHGRLSCRSTMIASVETDWPDDPDRERRAYARVDALLDDAARCLAEALMGITTKGDDHGTDTTRRTADPDPAPAGLDPVLGGPRGDRPSDLVRAEPY